MTRPVVMWFRRDLRLEDHQALAAAIATSPAAVALFVDDPSLRRVSGAPRLAYLHDCLRELDGALSGALVVRRGDPVEVVPAVAREVGASEVFVTRDHTPLGRHRDERVRAALSELAIGFTGVGSNYAVVPGTVRKNDGSPYSVFTPFFRVWLDHLRAELSDPGVPRTPGAADWVRLDGDPLPERVDPGIELPAAGSAAATARWEEFAHGALSQYGEQRNLPGVDGTSRLSPALKWGTIHPVGIIERIVDDVGDPGVDPIEVHRTFISELAWREFYADVLFHRPESAWRNLNPAFDAMVVDTDAEARARFARWAEGSTGFPIVDAGMRQLNATGWMHNRVRMIVASFLVKDLHLPWQWGAGYFMARLVDGDVASNSHGWQWTAGTGTDAAPYFRIFNPWSQQERYDPDGEFVAEWVPELETGSRPEPMLDHAVERDVALERYRALPSQREKR